MREISARTRVGDGLARTSVSSAASSANGRATQKICAGSSRQVA
jgi:hypothetical protein